MSISELSDKTRISIGLAVIAIGGGAVWLTTMYTEVQANTKANQEIAAAQKEINQALTTAQREYNTNLYQIRLEMAEIKYELKRLKK